MLLEHVYQKHVAVNFRRDEFNPAKASPRWIAWGEPRLRTMTAVVAVFARVVITGVVAMA